LPWRAAPTACKLKTPDENLSMPRPLIAESSRGWIQTLPAKLDGSGKMDNPIR
jgi:hypothetical protein